MMMCMESVYVVGGCKLLAKGCSWLAVHGYEVSFIPTKKTLLCMLWWRLQNSSRNVGFF